MLAQCLGSASVRAGHSVLFIRADALLAELGQARADRSYDKVFRRYLAPDLVILDDFGLRRLTAQQSNDLYELIVERHRRASFAITSNRSVDEWLRVIEDLGMRRLPPTAAEDLLESFTRRYETGAILVSSNRPVEDWGQVLSDPAAAGAVLERFLHHAEIIRLQGRSWRVHDRQRRRSTPPDAEPPNGAQ